SAVNNYISLRYDKLSTLSNAAGNGTDPGPRTCSGSICTITYQTLINEGILPSGYVPKNSFSSTDYTIQLKRSGTSPNYVIDGVVLTNAAWVEGGRVRYDLLGKAMQSAGIDSATTKTTSQMNGFGGTWTLQQSDFSAINKQGLLGFRVGYNASLYSAYLRRDGTLPMTGNLDMGNQDIKNAKDITAAGNASFGGKGDFGSNITSGGNITAAGQVIAHNGYGDVITFGGDANNNDYEISLGSPKQLTIYSPSAANYTTVLQVNRNTKIDQRLSTNGLDPNEMPPGFSAGGVRTVDVVATGSFYSILAGTTISEGKFGFYARQDGNVKASGNMTVDGRIKTGEYLEIGSVVTAGTSCSPAGLLGRDSTGQVLSCKGGIWSPEMPVGIPQPWPSA
ncbi:MAG: shufflon system plasmid conjugative transfer pilus tip adhesin PilV, partial [Pseudomonas aeruginosa]|nr:shufflon system plasmid conjugative transfer pilus tip adhesin PilV [Pseudomonas aeruginosa]